MTTILIFVYAAQISNQSLFLDFGKIKGIGKFESLEYEIPRAL